ncbi:biotin holocarboxylase synthetase [Tulasnella sp. 330]|nr:biotin holocarboxylase synthetase [Tulasnella sp. 330]KAG8878124.1 biotin holocarboxylase synthetase [Tulasnella sp. 331]
MSINVLIYNGPGVSQTSFAHALTSLRHLLSPNYTVTPITPASLISDPWTASCALLVIPGGRDLPYVASLQPGATDRIKQYVREGGSLLGICAGAYFSSARVEWEVSTRMEVIGDRALGFFPGTSKGCAFPGFVYESEAGAILIDVKVSEKDGGEEMTARGLYWNGGGYFDGAEGMQSQGVRVLARYSDGAEGAGAGKPAAVLCDVGEGRAILWGPHIEFPLNRQPALSAASVAAAAPKPEELVVELEAARLDLLTENLELLGLQCSTRASKSKGVDPMAIVGTLPQLLVSTPSKPHIISNIISALTPILSPMPTSANATCRILEDAHDTFRVHEASMSSEVMTQARSRKVTDEKELGAIERDIVVFEGGSLPPAEQTPLFSLTTYFEHLSLARSELHLKENGKSVWGIGEAMLYGERVTSTQTLLDKNPTLLSTLPSSLLSLATQQLSGRGRGSNVWLSPPEGCLQFSLLLRPPQSPAFRPSSLVFIQYLFGLAVVEACRKVLPNGAGEKVRLKWPNDLYVKLEGEGGEVLKKVGGILVTTNFGGGGVADVVVGCGLNVLNPFPTTSLSQLLSPQDASALTLEHVAATILPVFEQMWGTFLARGGTFEPFVDLYLQRWLHSDKIVTLTTTTPHREVRVVGITPDYGLLRTVPTSGGESMWGGPEYIDLQPDGNSFDMMAGLIRLKK